MYKYNFEKYFFGVETSYFTKCCIISLNYVWQKSDIKIHDISCLNEFLILNRARGSRCTFGVL